MPDQQEPPEPTTEEELAYYKRENAKLRRGLELLVSGRHTAEERKAFCRANGIDTADANAVAQAALKL